MTLAAQFLREIPSLRDEALASEKLTTLDADSKTVRLDRGADLHVVEGDLLYDRDELLLYALREDARLQNKRLGIDIAAVDPSAALAATAPDGRIVRWRPGTLLTYCILRASFSEAEYGRVQADIAVAAEAWEQACGVAFKHLEQYDGHEDVTATPNEIGSDVIFTVRKLNADGKFIAAAFFPTYPPPRRRVLIDPSFFDSTLRFDPAGVLRHELGHVLGFRHEHINSQAPATCPDEPTFETKWLTEYDPKSVMHYFCGSVGSSSLELTDLDRQGAQRVYGPSFESMVFFD